MIAGDELTLQIEDRQFLLSGVGDVIFRSRRGIHRTSDSTAAD